MKNFLTGSLIVFLGMALPIYLVVLLILNNSNNEQIRLNNKQIHQNIKRQCVSQCTSVTGWNFEKVFLHTDYNCVEQCLKVKLDD